MPRFWVSLLLLLLSLICLNAAAKMHYHRTLLSDYKPQHSRKTQLDYRAHKPTYVEEDGYTRKRSNVAEPKIAMVDTNVTTQLRDLLVRIYRNGTFLCMGTLISDRLIITTATCFINVEPNALAIKTHTNEVREANLKPDSSDFLLASDPLLTVLSLSQPMTTQNSSVQLCTSKLDPPELVELPTYMRNRRMVKNMVTAILPLSECRRRMKDASGKAVSDKMICVENKKATAHCQNTFGNPLVHKGMICGVNILGHNCPSRFGVDLYVSVYSAADYLRRKLDSIRAAKLEESIF